MMADALTAGFLKHANSVDVTLDYKAFMQHS